MTRVLRWLLVACLASGVTACGPAAEHYALTTWADGGPWTCLGGFLDQDIPMTLHGKLESGVAKAWAGDGHAILWPPGYFATFSPELTVYDRAGHERGHEGENMATSPAMWHQQRACITAGPSGLMYAPDAIVQVLPPAG